MRGVPNTFAIEKFDKDLSAAAGADADVPLAAIAQEFHVIDAVHWSFDASHAAGYLEITFGGVTKWYEHMGGTFGQGGTITFPGGLCTGTVNEGAEVTLSPPAGVSCKVSVDYR